jgi:hypothetical protein
MLGALPTCSWAGLQLSNDVPQAHARPSAWRPNGVRAAAPTGQPYGIADVVPMHVQVRDYQRQNGPRYSLVVPGPVESEF